MSTPGHAGADGISGLALLSAATVVSNGANITSGVMLWGALKQYFGGQEYRDFLKQHCKGTR